jgi:predicted ABC-type transport system involved in lysophospholipase L1 biosynthesis ATPase subunit
METHVGYGKQITHNPEIARLRGCKWLRGEQQAIALTRRLAVV